MESKKLRGTASWMLLIKDVQILEHDAAHRYRFNRFWALVWMGAIIGVLLTLWPHTKTELVELLILEVSMWGNFSTHFEAMNAALATQDTTRIMDDVITDISDDDADLPAIEQEIKELLG